MKLHLDQDDLFAAVRLFIENEGISLTGKKVNIDFTAGRGSNGHYADVNLSQENEGQDDVVDPFSEPPLVADQEEIPFEIEPASENADPASVPDPGEDDTGINFDDD